MENEGSSRHEPDFRHPPRKLFAEAQELVTKVQNLDALIKITERRLSEAEAGVKRQRRYVLENPADPIPQAALVDFTKEFQALEAVLKGYREARAELEGKILEVRNLPEAERESLSAKRRRASEIVTRRLERYGEIDQRVEELRPMLSECNKDTEELERIADELDLHVHGGFDSARYEKLAASLPKDLLEESERWCGWFLGKPKGGQRYIVRVQSLVLPESLAHHGVFVFGDSVYLNDQEAEPLLSADFWAPTREHPWRCEVPKIMTAESFSRVLVTAQEKQISPETVCFFEDALRDASEKDWYKRNGAPRTQKRRIVAPEDNIAFEGTMMVKAKVTGSLDHDGKQRERGEIVEMTLADAWRNFDAGVIGPPW
jgi:hypothetical protein